jgi:hypothetical protein
VSASPRGVGGEAHEPSPHASSTMLNMFQIQWHIILLDFGRSEAKAPAKPKAGPERGGGLAPCGTVHIPLLGFLLRDLIHSLESDCISVVT